MGKKLLTTPRSRIRAALRQMWMRSRERAAAIKREKNTCQRCKRKGSKAEGKEVAIRVHHIHEIDWDGVIDIIIERILQTPDDYEVLCKECHDEHHKPKEVKTNELVAAKRMVKIQSLTEEIVKTTNKKFLHTENNNG